MFFLGLFLLIVGAVLAFVFHYHQDVKKRNEFGVLMIDNYATFLVKKIAISIFLLMIMVPGFALFIWGIVSW